MENNYLAYFKYSGEKTREGYMDAKKSAEALLGIDEVLRFLIYKKAPELSEIKFDIPIKIQKGSWEN